MYFVTKSNENGLNTLGTNQGILILFITFCTNKNELSLHLIQGE